MLWIALAILNIPVYLFLGWLVFDSKEKAADSFGETILMLVTKTKTRLSIQTKTRL